MSFGIGRENSTFFFIIAIVLICFCFLSGDDDDVGGAIGLNDGCACRRRRI